MNTESMPLGPPSRSERHASHVAVHSPSGQDSGAFEEAGLHVQLLRWLVDVKENSAAHGVTCNAIKTVD